MIVVEPITLWTALDLREVWRYRELLYFLIWRDVKVRYRQTALGAAWAILQPLLTMIVFTLLFGRLAGLPSDGIPYAVFAYAGLLLWTFFANAITHSSNSLINSGNLITKVYFPRMVIPIAAVGAQLIDFLIAFLILIAMVIYFGLGVSWSVLMLPVLVLMITLLAISVGLWLSAVNVKYRDVRYAVPFLIQLWMFASPIIYPLSLIPAKWRWVMALNPLAGIIESFRVSSLGLNGFVWPALIYSATLTVALFIYSASYFQRMEQDFADII